MRKFKLAALLLLVCMGFNDAQAQGKYGKDSIQCVTNLNMYTGEYKRKNYTAALPLWRECMKYCPLGASQNIYIAGSAMMRDLIEKTTDPQLKKARVDTLLMLYDRRMENFKVDKTDQLFRKASEIEIYLPEEKKRIYDAYNAAIDSNKDKVDGLATAKCMMIAKSMFEANQMDVDQFTEAYTYYDGLADKRCKANPSDTVLQNYKMAIESAFLATSAADCDNLIKVFGKRFAGHENEIDVVRTVVGQLGSRECTQNELYYQAVEAYNKLSPSPGASYGLAKMYYAKGDKTKALEYFKSATDTETDNIEKSKYFQEFGGLALKEGSISLAVTYAKQALSANPRNGRAYLLLGTAYGNVKGCGDDDISKRSVFWVAIDQFSRAKQVDPSLADEANKSINTYSQYFPTQTDAFYLDLTDGQSYTVSCGPINERTTVRTKK